MLALALYFRLTAFPVEIFSSPDKSSTTAIQPSASIKSRQTYAADADKAGRWIAEKLGQGHNYMVPAFSKLIYPLNGFWTATPVADYERLHGYAIGEGAEYFVAELDGSVPIEEITTVPPGLKFETMYRSPESGYTAAVYRFIPMENR